MDRMILGIFDNRSLAERAISDLHKLGYDSKDISIVMKDAQQATKISHDTGANVAEGAISGVTTGGVLGALAGLLVGIGAISIPGIGALLIGGPLAAAFGLGGAAATTVSGAVTGALAGGLVGALIGLGIPEEDARYYEDRIRAGAILVAVPAYLESQDEVQEILEENGATQVRTVTAHSVRSREEVAHHPAYFSSVKQRKE